ncbi:MAG: ADP-ribosylglycohydrolase family protein [Alphaproteobacteria bacterium]|jgi:ADP-ribosylglycohydrolase|nr:ADP-ribosylglycohydrolase family protein [Alphaproteobacteria bacterium]
MAKAALERFAGCLIGQCLGDALGFLVEGRDPETCARYVAELSPRRPPLGQRASFRFGQYSDDSQLARELMQSFAGRRGFDPADYAGRVAAIFSENRIVGRGRATEQAAQRLAAGVLWSESGTPAPSAGNGSAMRAGPVGVLFSSDPAALIAVAHDQGCITHADPRCSAGAVAVAGAVALALEPGAIEVSKFVARLVEWCRRLDAGFADRLSQLPGWLELRPADAVVSIARAGLAADYDDPWPGISPFVVPSVIWSLYAFLRTPEDYWAAISTAIAVGGDVDTTAAMTGAMAGARVGLEALPPLARQVHDQGTWGYEELVALSGECHALVD